MSVRDRRLAPVYALVLSFSLAWCVGTLLPGRDTTTIRFVIGDGTPVPGLADRQVEVHWGDCAGLGAAVPGGQQCWSGKAGDRSVTIRLEEPEPAR